jgi:hypothetical protein
VYLGTKMSKRTNKRRFQISLSPKIAKAGKRLAREEGRSFSNLLENLIVRAEEPARAKAA